MWTVRKEFPLVHPDSFEDYGKSKSKGTLIVLIHT